MTSRDTRRVAAIWIAVCAAASMNAALAEGTFYKDQRAAKHAPVFVSMRARIGSGQLPGQKELAAQTREPEACSCAEQGQEEMVAWIPAG